MIKPKVTGLFLEISEYGMVAIKASGLKAPLVIEDVKQSPLLSIEQTKEFIQGISGANSNQFSVANCSFYPQKRFFINTAIEDPIKGRDDPKYFPTLLRDKFKIEVQGNSILVLNPYDGSEFGAPPLPKQVLFCGAPVLEIESWQDLLVDCLVYPEVFEMGTISGLGGIMSYIEFQKIQENSLVLELSTEGVICFIFKGNKLDNIRMIHFGLNYFLKSFQEQMNIEDAQIAKEKFFEGNFNFSEFLKKTEGNFIKELQSFISFYELQHNTRIQHMFFTLLPNSLNGLAEGLAGILRIQLMKINYVDWLQSKNITVGKNVRLEGMGSALFNIISLMIHHQI